jgi:putative ABC transport system permease protein
LDGRNFDPSMATDSNAFIINEAAIKKFGWKKEDVLNKTITWSIFENETKAKVIGLVKDFHYESLHAEIDPLIIRLAPREDFWQTMMSIKFNGTNSDDVLRILEKKWNEFESSYPFEYSLLSEDYEQLYENEKKLGTLVLLFTLLAILVACLGLVGLTNFMTDKRTKEIGIRKTFGANSTKIIWALSNEFTFLILIANIIAWPLAYYFSLEFMQNFAYQKPVSVWIFILATIITIAITLLTILYQSYKIAIKNPTESLRYE